MVKLFKTRESEVYTEDMILQLYIRMLELRNVYQVCVLPQVVSISKNVTS